MTLIQNRLILTGTLLALTPTALFAQRSSPASPTAMAKPRAGTPRPADGVATLALVRGTVRGPSGEPVPGATIWLVMRRDDEFDRPLLASADANGRFAFPDVDEQALFAAGEQSAAVIARDADGRLGWFELRRSQPGQTPCEVRLHEAADIEGHIVEAEGRPVAGAKLAVESLYEPRGRTERPRGPPTGSTRLFPDLAAEYRASAGGEGEFQLSRLPRGARISCALSASGLNKIYVVLDAGRPATLRVGQPGSIAGSVTLGDEDGAAVKGFQVRVSLQPKDVEGDEVPLSCTDTFAVDETGTFHFDGLPPGSYVVAPVERQNAPLYAEVPVTVEVAPGQRVTDVSLPLKHAQTLRGSVIDSQTGEGVAGVHVAVSSASLRQQTINDSQTAVTQGDGSFTAWLKPGEFSVSVSRVPDEYLPLPADKRAPQAASNGEWPPIALSRAVRIEGIVVDDEGMPVPLAELQVNQSPFHRRAFPQQADRSGKFVLRQVDPAEPISVRARTATMVSEADLPIAPSPTVDPAAIVVSRKAACWVSGQVVDDEGRPLPEARVAIVAMHEYYRTAGGAYNHRSTDIVLASDGTFESEAMWSGDEFWLEVSLGGFAALETGRVRGEPGMVHDFGPLTLRRILEVAVEVVDESGRPMPGATLRVTPTQSARRRARAALTDMIPYEVDGEGRCLVSDIEPSDTLAVWARSGSAVSAGAEVAWGSGLERPMRIVVSEKHACRLRGRVTDRAGRPVPDAKVAVVWDRRGDWRASRQRATARIEADGPQGVAVCATNASGTFCTEAIWPDEHYYVVISAEGFETIESPIVLAATGGTRDLGTFSPRRCDSTVEGRVLDADGNPIEGASVSNSGDALAPRQEMTDAEGRFRLEGLLEGRVYALVRKPGYQVAGLRAMAGDRALAARLRPQRSVEQNDPPAGDENQRASAVLALTPSAEESRLVAQLLTELWKLRDRVDQDDPTAQMFQKTNSRIVECLARSDLALALKWSAAVGGRFDDAARLVAAQRIVDEDVDEAIALLSGVIDANAGNALRKIARRRLLAGDSRDAARLVRAAAAPGRMPEGPQGQAEIGALAVAVGDYEWGRQLILEALDGLSNAPPNRFTGQPQAAVYAAVAAIDPKRAVRLWEGFPPPRSAPDEFYANLANAAVAMAPIDLQETRRLLQLLERRTANRASRRDWPDWARLRIAYRFASDQPKLAIGFLVEMSATDVQTKADAHGWVARRIAPHDRRQADELIDRAFEFYLDHTAGQTFDGGFGGPPVEAARLALHAQACGYADMASIVDRVLAVRLTPAGEQSRAAALRAPSPATLVESTVNTGRLLALIDPGVARELLLAAQPQAHLVGTSGGSVPRGAWLQAWALVDLDQAETMFREELALQTSQARPDLIESGLLPMLELLSRPPAERVRHMFGESERCFWFPGDE